VVRFDVLPGKHGDHVGGELDALRSLQRGDVDACAMLDLNWETWTSDGTIDPQSFRVIAETPRFDHCVFTVREDLDPLAERQWLDALFAMRYDIPEHREMMDLEGLKAWLPGRTSGFAALAAAVDAERFFEREANQV
jgi:phosphonate transport system substrate-binding protein